MASFLDELASYIDAQVAGVVFDNATGRNLFLNELPPDPDTCSAILGIVGTTVGVARDVPGLKFPRFQIVTRAKDYETASTRHEAIRDLLHGKIGLDLTTYRVLRIHAEQDGGPLGQDKQGRHEFSVNLIAEYHVKP